MTSPDSTTLHCEVCGQKARGKHYGAVACRACAAFFRRAEGSDIIKPCRRDNECEFFKNGFFNCKWCRLQKCFDVGMTSDNFQFDRDNFHVDKKTVVQWKKAIPQSVDVFSGRPNFIIFCAPQTASGSSKSFIDVQFLLDRALTVLQQGTEGPFHAKNRLGKLALGLIEMRKSDDLSVKWIELEKFGKDQVLALWEMEILKMTRWLTYFDDFQLLPQHLQIKMLKDIWKIWGRLEKLAMIAREMRKHMNEEEIGKLKRDSLICQWDHMEIETSWFSKRVLEELKFFVDLKTEVRADEMIRAMLELQPTDEELSYMLCQLCFHYVGKKNQGEILGVVEKFQEVIANDLHDYYVRDQKRPHYVDRLARMMKINNMIHKEVFQNRSRLELAVIFDVFCIEFSHPEMFEDY